MKTINIKKLTLTAIFAAIAVVGSTFSVPVFGSKAAPIQHLINVLSAIILGPWWALAGAFIASFIRNISGLGTLLAFPGSLFGALLAGLLYQKTKNTFFAYFGEVFGTGIIGGLVSFPVAAFIMGNAKVSLFTFVIPFLISTSVGTIIAVVVVNAMQKTGVLNRIKEGKNDI